MDNIFTAEVSSKITNRIQKLTSTTIPKWGKMSVDQMLAHCNVTYEMAFENIHPKPGFFKAFMLKTFVKNLVVNEVPYKNNSRTAPEFIVNETKDFEKEKARLIVHIQKAQALGSSHFEGKESHSFGKLTSSEWNNMFIKHLDHHLAQFGV
jgi:Protein of unknown function (DUF1569)